MFSGFLRVLVQVRAPSLSFVSHGGRRLGCCDCRAAGVSISWMHRPRMESLGQVGTLHVIFRGATRLFHSSCTVLRSTQQCTRVPGCTLANTCYLFVDSLSSVCEVASRGCNLCLPDDQQCRASFTGLLVTCASPLDTVCLDPLPIFSWVICHFVEL